MTAQADILFERELWETAVTLRGTVAPADYKHYVLPLLFLRYLSLRYEQRKAELVKLIKEPSSDYYTGDPDIDAEILTDQSEYEKQNIYIIPEEASWETIRRYARAGDIKLRIDNAMRALEEAYPAKLGGVLPRIYAGSNLTTDQVAGLINLFSKEVFSQKNGADSWGAPTNISLPTLPAPKAIVAVSSLPPVVSSSCWSKCWRWRGELSLTPLPVRVACLCSRPALPTMPVRCRFTGRRMWKRRCVWGA